MNYCVNHPDAVVTAYCQNCGKGLCSACVRTMQGNIYCEPCLTARASGTGAQGPFAAGYVPPPPGSPNPGTAAILGFIPGVGAMYNGQYIKAIVHVLVFVVLIGISEHYGLFGIFLGVWVLYQVFDAHQTAKARRDGLPLPDPFGLNELGNRIGGHVPPPPVGAPYVPPPPPPAANAGYPPPPPPVAGATGPHGQPYQDWAEQVRQQAHEWGRQGAEWGEQLRQRIVSEAARAGQPSAAWGVPPGPPPPGAGYVPPPPPPGWGPTAPPGYVPPGAPPGWVPPQMELERARREPIGAIVLILLGMLFLFNTLGFFSFGWISHGWPLIIVAIAIWLLMRNGGGRFRMGAPPTATPPTPPGTNSPEPPAGGVR